MEFISLHKRKLGQIHSIEITSWYKRKIQKREPSRHNLYVSSTKLKIYSVFGNTPKKYVAWYFQLKVGHGRVGTYLVQIRRIKTPEYW